jgi:hypothetical protein
MTLNETPLDRKYFLSQNVVYKIENTNSKGGGPVSENDESLIGIIDTFQVTRISKTPDDAGNYQTYIDKYCLDFLIEPGDFVKGGKMVKINGDTLKAAFYKNLVTEVKDFIKKYPTSAVNQILSGKANLPNWFFTGIEDKEYTYELEEGFSKMDIQSETESIKKSIIEEELAKFKAELHKKYQITE